MDSDPEKWRILADPVHIFETLMFISNFIQLAFFVDGLRDKRHKDDLFGSWE